MKRIVKDKYIAMNLFIWVIAFIYFLVVLIKSPRQSDDIIYYKNVTDNITGYMKYALYYGNGRLLGNFFGILFAKKRIIYAIAGSMMLVAITILPIYILSVKKELQCLLALFVILCPGDFYDNLYKWSSAFANYIPPIVLCEIILCIIVWNNRSNNSPKYHVLCAIIISIFSLLAQLFVEHMIIAISVLSIFFYIRREQLRFDRSLTFCFSFFSLLGGMCNFIIPQIFISNERMDWYNYMKEYRGALSNFYDNLDEEVINLYVRLGMVSILIVGCAVITFYLTRKIGEKEEKVKLSKIIIYISSICIIILFMFIFNTAGSFDINYLLNTLVLIIWFVLMLLSFFCARRIPFTTYEKFILYFMLFIILNVIITFPIAMGGARLIYFTYYCCSLLAIMWIHILCNIRNCNL